MAIEAQGLVKEYGKRRVVDRVSLEVHPGEVVGLLGPNGAGKTTSFYMIVGLEKPLAGRSKLMEPMSPPCPCICGLVMVFLIWLKNRRFSQIDRGTEHSGDLGIGAQDKKKRIERCNQLLEDFNLTKVRKQKGFMLSGGERRRVEVPALWRRTPLYSVG